MGTNAERLRASNDRRSTNAPSRPWYRSVRTAGRRVSVVTRLTLAVVFVGVASAGAVVLLGWDSGRAAIVDARSDTLRSVRSAKAAEVERNLATVTRETETLAASPATIEALRTLIPAFAELEDRDVSSLAPRVRDYYRALDAAAAAPIPEGVQTDLVPTDPAAVYLQYHYRVAVDSADQASSDSADAPDLAETLDAGDGSSWSEAHATVHRQFTALAAQLGYRDVLLIGPAGHVLYTVHKLADLGTDLTRGPLSASGLATTLASTLDLPPGDAAIADFERYPPAGGAPRAFIAAIVEDDGFPLGFLAVELAPDAIDDVMTSGGNWTAEGFGNTGEAYLVGPDDTFRSNSRAYIEDPDAYLNLLAEDPEVDPASIDAIRATGTTVLNQDARSSAVDAAFSIDEGVITTHNYLGEEVLSAYEPLNAPGLDWVIVTDLSTAEAFNSMRDVRDRSLALLAVVAVAVTFLGLAFARRFIAPVVGLVGAARDYGPADPRPVPVRSQDEFGRLTQAFNRMGDELSARAAELEQAEQERLRLLRAILPPTVAQRVELGDRHVVDSVPQATVVVVIAHGLSELVRTGSQLNGRAALGRLSDVVDSLGHRHGVERIRVFGNAFFGVCGLNTPYLDHPARTATFAARIVEAARAIGVRQDVELGVAVGIHTGPVHAGLVGSRRLVYDLWGETVMGAYRLALAAAPGEVLLSERTRALLPADLEVVEDRRTIPGAAGTEVWRLASSATQPLAEAGQPPAVAPA
jgi:class 3 adenylate cyclase